jgi:hypothetical protein
MIESRDDLLDSEGVDTGRGQLNRQWQAVEPATHLHRCWCILRCEGEGREDRSRALNKQLNGLIGQQPFYGRRLIGIRHTQG